MRPRARFSFAVSLGPILAACLAVPPPAATQTVEVVLPSIQDNTLYENSQGSLSNGSGPGMFVGTSGPTNPVRRRALVKFDVASSVPAGATIVGVELALYVNQSSSGDRIVRVHRLLASWGEGASVASGGGGGGGPASTNDATWVHRFYDTQTWSTPGGDFAAAPSEQTTVGDSGSFTWRSTQALVEDVQSWLDQPAENFGWILIGEESGVSAGKRFATRESSAVEQRPQLLVTYSGTAVAGSTWTHIRSLYR